MAQADKVNQVDEWREGERGRVQYAAVGHVIASIMHDRRSVVHAADFVNVNCDISGLLYA